MLNKEVHLHLISDSTGETVSSIARTVVSVFDSNIHFTEHTWSLIRTQNQLQKTLEGIRKNKGIVLYTLFDEMMQKTLQEECENMNVPAISAVSGIVNEFKKILGNNADYSVGRQHRLDEDYFKRVEAINYTLNHDDGQGVENLATADIVLVGVSRSSKTPTCIYLSLKGYYVANIPFVKGIELPEELFKIKDKLIIGLVISPERLMQIRRNRLSSLNEERETDYANMEAIKAEVTEARRIFAANKWKTIDVTRSSVEETVAKIIQIYNKHKHIS